jgi:hypothetical protein
MDNLREFATTICDFLGVEASSEEVDALTHDLETIYKDGWNDALVYVSDWTKTLKKEQS